VQGTAHLQRSGRFDREVPQANSGEQRKITEEERRKNRGSVDNAISQRSGGPFRDTRQQVEHEPKHPYGDLEPQHKYTQAEVVSVHRPTDCQGEVAADGLEGQ